MADMAEEEMKPCPFCGGRPERAKKYMRCEDCGASGPYTSEDIDDDQCEKDWNTRVDAALREPNEEEKRSGE